MRVLVTKIRTIVKPSWVYGPDKVINASIRREEERIWKFWEFRANLSQKKITT